MNYSSRHIQQVFNISRETVRNWAVEFSEYLSIAANPGGGRARQFEDADMHVFALIAELKDKNMLFSDIHAALKSGQRGDMPAQSREIATTSPEQRGIRALQQQVVELAQERDLLLKKTEQQQGQIELLKEQMDQREKQIRGLYRELARLEAAQDAD